MGQGGVWVLVWAGTGVGGERDFLMSFSTGDTVLAASVELTVKLRHTHTIKMTILHLGK